MKRLNSKKKGKRGENELANILNKKFGEGRFKRVPFSGAITGGKNRNANQNFEMKEAYTSDIAAPADFNFVIEHKFYADISFWELLSEKSNWNEWINQVNGDADFVNKIPLLVIKYNRHDRIALIPFQYLIKYSMTKPEIESKIHEMAKSFIWKSFSVVSLQSLLDLPLDFWFTERTTQ